MKAITSLQKCFILGELAIFGWEMLAYVMIAWIFVFASFFADVVLM